jgi:hypothetical protein
MNFTEWSQQIVSRADSINESAPCKPVREDLKPAGVFCDTASLDETVSDTQAQTAGEIVIIPVGCGQYMVFYGAPAVDAAHGLLMNLDGLLEKLNGNKG